MPEQNQDKPIEAVKTTTQVGDSGFSVAWGDWKAEAQGALGIGALVLILVVGAWLWSRKKKEEGGQSQQAIVTGRVGSTQQQLGPVSGGQVQQVGQISGGHLTQTEYQNIIHNHGISMDEALKLADTVAVRYKAEAAEARAEQVEMENQVAQGKEQLAKAIHRAAQAEADHDLPHAERLIEELRKSKDTERLQHVLVELRDRHRDDLIARNHEISTVAYLREDFAVAEGALCEILALIPNDQYALNNLGLIHRLRGELDNAETSFKKVLLLARDNKTLQTAAYGNLSIVYQTRGDLDKAEEYCKKSLDIEEALGHKEGMANDYGILGIVYGAREDLDKAEEYFQKALTLNEALGNKRGMANDYGNLGIVYRTHGDLVKTREHWQRSLELYKEVGAKLMIDKVQGWLDALPK